MVVALLLAGDFAEELYDRGDFEAARVEYLRQAHETDDLYPAFRAG